MDTLSEELSLYESDSKFRTYSSAIDKLLRLFEGNSEWADLINSLGRLSKTLNQYGQKFQVIPRKLIVAKRLAQVLHPALPSGVHLKALETYDTIFKIIGKKRLAQDIFIYSAGLFPLLAASSMSVKPKLLDLYEEHFLPLGSQLEPALVSLIHAILPGLEENSEYYSRTYELLTKFQICHTKCFYGHFWSCIGRNESTRFQGLSFLQSKAQRQTDYKLLFGNDIDLMVNAFCECLTDSNFLVQRISLDLISTMFPFQQAVLSTEQFTRLCSTSLNVLLRRDLSLNRRLYSWLCHESEKTALYDEKILLDSVKAMIIFSRKISLSNFGTDRAILLRPIRIVIFLLDKHEIGSVILEDVLLEIFRYLYMVTNNTVKHKLSSSETKDFERSTNKHKYYFNNKITAELTKTTHILFQSIETDELWKFLANFFEECCHRKCLPEQRSSLGFLYPALYIPELCNLISFFLEIISLDKDTYEEAQQIYVPSLLLSIFGSLQKHITSISLDDLQCALSLCEVFLTKVIPSANYLSGVSDRKDKSTSHKTLLHKCFNSFKQLMFAFLLTHVHRSNQNELSARLKYLTKKQPGGSKSLNREIRRTNIISSLHAIHNAFHEQKSSETDIPTSISIKDVSGFNICYKIVCQILMQFASFPFYSSSKNGSNQNIEKCLPDWLNAILVCACFVKNFDVASRSISTLLYLFALVGNSQNETAAKELPTIKDSEMNLIRSAPNIFQTLAIKLWIYLDIKTPEYYEKSVELFYQLHNLCPDADLCEDIVILSMEVDSANESCLDSHRRFTVLWHLTRAQSQSGGASTAGQRSYDRSLLRMLDGLVSSNSSNKTVVERWLSHAVKRDDIGRILEPLLLILLNKRTNRFPLFQNKSNSSDRSIGSTLSISTSLRLSEDDDEMVMDSEFFDTKIESALDVVDDILSDVLDEVFLVVSGKESPSSQRISEKSNSTTSIIDNEIADNDETMMSKDESISFNFVCFYKQIYDFQRTLHILELLISMINVERASFISALTKSSISNSNTPYVYQVQHLLARHRKSLLGNDFYSAIVPEDLKHFRSTMYIEILLSVPLYYLRSFFGKRLNVLEADVYANYRVQVKSTQLLISLTNGILDVLSNKSSKTFYFYLNDLFLRCKIQKSVIFSLIAFVKDDTLVCGAASENSLLHKTSNTYTLQMHLLDLLLVLIKIEYRIFTGEKIPTEKGFKKSMFQRVEKNKGKYSNTDPIVAQPVFMSALLDALTQYVNPELHSHWINLVIAVLPFAGNALREIAICTVNQLCKSIELFSSHEMMSKVKTLPSDHVIFLIEGLTSIVFYCTVDASIEARVDYPNEKVKKVESKSFLSLFQATPSVAPILTPEEIAHASKNQHRIDARKAVFDNLPRIVASLLACWKFFSKHSVSSDSYHSYYVLGQPSTVKHYILEFLNPLALSNLPKLLAAIALVWNGKRKKSIIKSFIEEPNEDQECLVDLIKNVKPISLDTIMPNIVQLFKMSPPGSKQKYTSIEIGILQFFLAYFNTMSNNTVLVSWAKLQDMIKECLALVDNGEQIILFQIFNNFVMRFPQSDEIKDLHETVTKLSESLNLLAGQCLLQSAWIGKQFVVKQGQQLPFSSSDVLYLFSGSADDVNSKLNSALHISNASVQALEVIAENLANLLDVIYRSEEKERALPVVISLSSTWSPYLRHRLTENIPSYRASSKLLANFSGYQYARRAWRKEAMDILMEKQFFSMTPECITHWRIVIDNLMTQDKVSFKEFLNQTSITGISSILRSRDTDQEIKSQLLKRLGFIIYASDVDQYSKLLPDLQERIVELLRIPSPFVLEQVFLFFRVMLIRFSPNSMVSFWPLMIGELISCLIQLEYDLKTLLGESNKKYAQNGSFISSHPMNSAWLDMFLSACKFLDLSLVMAKCSLAQFQSYTWAFIGNEISASEQTSFIPYCRSVSSLLERLALGNYQHQIVVRKAGYPLLLDFHIRDIDQLQPFFTAICCEKHFGADSFETELVTPPQIPLTPDFKSLYDILVNEANSCKEFIEKMIERDFCEMF